ncbi:homeobox protein MOX-1 isoform X2 [Mus pahari]|uniref:homeobox protein MOX-1 isoform X2 n=1 Tax=Mus pahari TaxID=10093 RepID=UPI000A30C4AA|nr:homeobox protein MOX-1 isoform X2 [Mus pahari]
MDPVVNSCVRNPQPPAPIWGCLRNPLSEDSSASGLSHYPPTPFSFHQKSDFPATTAYPDFSASCLAATPHSLPRTERIFNEQHPAFPQTPDWHFPISEAGQRLNLGPAGSARDMGAGSPGLVDGTAGLGEDCMVLGTIANETEKKSSRRKKERSGQSLVPEPEDEVETCEGGSACVPTGAGPRGWGLCSFSKF